MADGVVIESISAVTLGVRDMGRSVRFYRALGFEVRYGGEEASFTSLRVGGGHLNLQQRAPEGWWGRVILYVSDVDAMHERVVTAGVTPDFEPRNAPWGERYFHVVDPDGHELSFAQPLRRGGEDAR